MLAKKTESETSSCKILVVSRYFGTICAQHSASLLHEPDLCYDSLVAQPSFT